MSPSGRPDWVRIARVLNLTPLPASLPALEELVADSLRELDLWLYDYGLSELRSLRHGATWPADRPGRTPTPPGVTGPGGGPIGGDRALRSRLQLHGQFLGFLTAESVEGAADAALGQVILDDLAPLLASSVPSSDLVTDAVAVARRRRPLSLAAEMQWSVLPPTRFELGRWAVSAAVEPAYETGGDVFDYAERDGHLMLAVIDAMGHGLEAAVVSAVAVSGLRRARRSGSGLLDLAAEIDRAVLALPSAHFVSAVLVDIDLATGRGGYLSAGHVPPLVVTGDRVEELPLVPTLPLGLRVGSASSRPQVRPLRLEPGQTLVLYSDGVVDERAAPPGAGTGFERFADLTVGALAVGDAVHPARDVVDGLLLDVGPDLKDDATLLLCRYR